MRQLSVLINGWTPLLQNASHSYSLKASYEEGVTPLLSESQYNSCLVLQWKRTAHIFCKTVPAKINSNIQALWRCTSFSQITPCLIFAHSTSQKEFASILQDTCSLITQYFVGHRDMHLFCNIDIFANMEVLLLKCIINYWYVVYIHVIWMKNVGQNISFLISNFHFSPILATSPLLHNTIECEQHCKVFLDALANFKDTHHI